MKTNITIVSTNLSRNILNNYKDYYLIDDNFTYNELLNNKKVIFFNVLNNLSENELKKLFSFMKSNNIDFINITNNMETSLYTNYLMIYDKENILAEGNTLEILKEEKLLKRIGLRLPFIIELSILLKDYNLVDKIYLDKESLVGDLWK